MSIQEALERIVIAIEKIASVVDGNKNLVRIEDVERGKVYATHLGDKLQSGS